MAERTKVIVGRRWHHPDIYVRVNHDGIDMQIAMDDFIKAVATEVGSPALLMRPVTLQAKMLAATEIVLAEVKRASAEVV